MFLISGGGSSQGLVETNRWFAEHIEHGRVLYIPLAGDPNYRSYEDSYSYVSAMFQEVGIEETILCTDLNNLNSEYLKGFEAIYFSGGSVAKLTQAILQADIANNLRVFEKEKVIYGQSAGAIAFGSAAGFYEDEICLSFIDYGIICHFDSNNIAEINRSIYRDVICVEDGHSFIFNNGDIEPLVGEVLVVKANEDTL
ncbi:Type 1 glutamine amidotransferase-like domain-containing protein [Macrococcus brunensis]|uniref:Type 1 glutamine amidotransferase-like domain-containing protein n=1 Tax=Macrococcus brunensis TaxID=198483 RepID=UPI001EEFD5EC|nr:Type 1 glutamine amidotransferase-like domain-containing protein [Macrococcus brunensis]ULG74457.1 Type 1 glutamine amidotransferase-like domain-containing protein [Macrococcus brunensis]